MFRKNVAENIFFAFCNYCLIGCPGGDSSGGFFNMQSLMKFFAVEGLFLSHKYIKKNFEVEIMEMGDLGKVIKEDRRDFVEGFKNLYENKPFKNDSSLVSKGTECVRYYLNGLGCAMARGYKDDNDCCRPFSQEYELKVAFEEKIIDKKKSIVCCKMGLDGSGGAWTVERCDNLNLGLFLCSYFISVGIFVWALLEEVSQNSSLLYALPIVPAIVISTLFDPREAESFPDRIKFYFKNYFFYDVFYFIFNYFLNYNSSNYNLNFLVICGLSFYHRWLMEYNRGGYLLAKYNSGKDLYDLLVKENKVKAREDLYSDFVIGMQKQYPKYGGSELRWESNQFWANFFVRDIFVEKKA